MVDMIKAVLLSNLLRRGLCSRNGVKKYIRTSEIKKQLTSYLELEIFINIPQPFGLRYNENIFYKHLSYSVAVISKSIQMSAVTFRNINTNKISDRV